MSYKDDTRLNHLSWLCNSLGKRVKTDDGEGTLMWADTCRITVVLDSDPNKLRVYKNIFDVVPIEVQK